ncbi:MAG: translation elongation factor Ts [Thermoflexales bacterium]|nr:translation elongation factor Ts [Thermoflexales bacterium]MDW8318610.1 translation elongation factor Ts [Anaerolineae bacterium]
MAITSEMIKQLREATGAGVLDCKKALEQANGDFEKATEILRQKGLAAAAKKAERAANEGIIGSYVHMGAKVAALVELNCETDFVARTEAFQTLARDLAMQVVASRPLYTRREEIPAADLERERAAYTAQLADSGKPDDVVQRIVEGKLEKFYQETCLLEQPFIKDPNLTVGDLVKQAVAKLGENIVVRRFARLEVGG